ncbi:MAG TPA: WbqC family protein [Rhodanobacter sp.]
MKIVISQSMYFPWVGLLEQIRLADVFVHYDDVQFTRGFYNRVQVKSSRGSHWLTVPIRAHGRETNIDQVLVDSSRDWREEHRNMLTQCYRSTPYFKDMMDVFDEAHSAHVTSLGDVSRNSILSLARYFDIDHGRHFVTSSSLDTPGRSSERLLEICRKLHASIYVTGQGAQNYLDHELFESNGINVEYMNYRKMSYPQVHGNFTPYVSGLDLVANCGRDGTKYICSETISWKEIISGP